ncbi:hypothetical protein A8C56_18730 [Niabella ginsenosidivorans]|uniref:Glycosyl hydrolase family 13 catalytic domain-containing protein n=2 Tax=Niabella ginsenosidivorans TaxID=1176587 RepID=A0A1A9I6R1_9BACT|nr:hypothetical protein A8C56_18730 [Niabella ginsenosidivorans]
MPGWAMASDIELQDKKLKVVFDSETGAITRLENVQTGWIINRRAALGISFRMHAPMPDRRFNYIYGQKQHAVVHQVSDSQIHFEWSNLKSENGGVLPLVFSATVTLADGKLTFTGKLINNSALTIETIDYPYLGDLNAPAKNASINARTMWYGNLETEEIYPNFDNRKGYWGVFNPTKTKGSHHSLYCLLQTSANQGLYVGVQEPRQRYYVEYTWEQHPANLNSVSGLVPRPDEVSGLTVNTEFRLCHFVFAAPHSATDLIPILFTPYNGDWQAGVDIYKEWRKTWFKKPNLPAWVKDVHSWLQLQINSPEDDWRVQFKDLYKYGKECADNGVTGIQLVGWNKLGQDGNDPSQDFEDHLGTWNDLRDAIKKIEDLGVHMVLFGKINWADKTTPAYKKEWYKYEVKDPYGIPYEQGGYSYYTPTQLAGINNHRRAIMDFNAPGYQEAITREFKKVLDLNPSGWLFDENCHHGPALYNFFPNGYKGPGYIYGGDMPLASKLNAMAFKRNPDFLFAGEGQMDWLLQNYQCSYFRMGLASTAVDRYIDSETPLVVAVTGIDDREKLNLILMDRYIISYEPYNFKGHVTDFPLTLAYGKKIDALRKKYKEWVWNAEFRDVLGATVGADGAHRYSVFVTASGKKAVVVANFEKDRGIHAHVRLEGKERTQFNVVTPETLTATGSEGEVDIPARSVVVLMEK